MQQPRRQSGNGLLVAILALIIIVLIAFNACEDIRFPGGSAHSIQLRPMVKTLAPGVPTTFEVIVVMNHPIPNIRKTFKVAIHEDDYWDDTLVGEVEVVYDPNVAFRPYAYGTFTLQCNDLQADGEFDLSSPGNGSSSDEIEHLVHGEGAGDASANISIKCAVPLPSDNGDEANED